MTNKSIVCAYNFRPYVLLNNHNIHILVVYSVFTRDLFPPSPLVFNISFCIFIYNRYLKYTVIQRLKYADFNMVQLYGSKRKKKSTFNIKITIVQLLNVYSEFNKMALCVLKKKKYFDCFIGQKKSLISPFLLMKK